MERISDRFLRRLSEMGFEMEEEERRVVKCRHKGTGLWFEVAQKYLVLLLEREVDALLAVLQKGVEDGRSGEVFLLVTPREGGAFEVEILSR